MQSIATLGTLMGLAFTSGIRLYSTVFAVGLIAWMLPKLIRLVRGNLARLF